MCTKNKIEKQKTEFLILISFASILLMTNVINAFGVASPYWNDGDTKNPLHMDKGETRIIEFNLQNTQGEEDIRVTAEIVKGQDIARLKKDIIVVKAKTTDTEFPLEIRIPKNTSGTYEVKLMFKEITSSESEAVKMGVGMKVSFDVIVSEKIVEEKPSFIKNYLWYIVALTILIIAILIIILILIKKKNPNIRKFRKTTTSPSLI